MVDLDVELQNLDDYFEPYVISQLMEELCRETLDDFKDHPGKTFIQCVSVVSNVPVIGQPGRLNVIVFCRAHKEQGSDLCSIGVDRIFVSDTIPDEILDAYNFCKKRDMTELS